MSEPLSEHLAPLDESWSIWKSFILRSTGFPITEVLRIASPGAAGLVDTLLDAEARAAEARRSAAAACEVPARAAALPQARSLRRAARKLADGKLPQIEPGWPAEVVQRCEASRAAVAEVTARREAASAAFERDAVRAAGELRALAQDPRFREALTWQNPTLARHSVTWLRPEDDAVDTSRVRARRLTIARYLQRYTTKNESIGFFGPRVLGRFTDDGPAIELVPGPGLISSSGVWFEHWGIDAIAGALASAPGMRRWLAPRRRPYVRLEGEVARLPWGDGGPLSALEARALAAATGERTADEIARALGEAYAEVEAALLALEGRGLLLWALEIPTEALRFERVLGARLARVRDPALRQRCAAVWRDLIAARRAIERAAGDADALGGALDALDALFLRVTGAKSATRAPGQLYAGRTLVNPGARRDVELALGPEVRRRLAPPMALLLTSARWYSAEVARVHREELRALYAAEAAEAGHPDVDAMRFAMRVAALLPPAGGKAPASVLRVADELRARWARILGLPSTGRRVERSVESIAEAVQAEFAADGPGWPGARCHAPDLMIAARDVDAIRRGDYQLVLGEIHITCNGFEAISVLREHSQRGRLREHLTRDFPSGRVAFVTPKAMANRAGIAPKAKHPLDVEIEMDDAQSWRPRAATLAIADLVVREIDGRVVITRRDGARAWDAVEFLNTLNMWPDLPLFAPAPYQPRITLGGLVVQREAWRIRTSDMPFADEATPFERFVSARRWARDVGLPRFVFARGSSERKPTYMDFASPTLIDELAKLARASESMTLSEMLPAHDQCWLVDAQGRRYTSELRTVLLDARAFRAP
ncbi:lantibiotic dehydratase [Sorangium sp. So ce1151]|uniref:lantibiotic dehydratase n=1 Tax=Sorangium sp. So ce1151 TaxID=3133332 RepID=UPI003F641D37